MKKLFRTPSNRQSPKEKNHKRVVYTYYGEPPSDNKYTNWISDTATGAKYSHDDSETHRAVSRHFRHNREDAMVFKREEIYNGGNVFVKETVIRRDTNMKSRTVVQQLHDPDYDLPFDDNGTYCAKHDDVCVHSKSRNRQSFISRTSIAAEGCFSPTSIEYMKRRPLPEIPVDEITAHDKIYNDTSSNGIHVDHKEVHDTMKLKCDPSKTSLNTSQSQASDYSTGECNDQNTTSTSSSFLHIGIQYDEEVTTDFHLPNISEITPELREEDYVDLDETVCKTFDENTSNGLGQKSDDSSYLYDFCVTPVYGSGEDFPHDVHEEITYVVSEGCEKNRTNMNELSDKETVDVKERQPGTFQPVECSEQNFILSENRSDVSKNAVLHSSPSNTCKYSETDEPSETYEDVDYEETTYLPKYDEIDKELQNLQSRNCSLEYMNENNQAKIAARREINERLKKDLKYKIKLAELEQEI